MMENCNMTNYRVVLTIQGELWVYWSENKNDTQAVKGRKEATSHPESFR